MTRADLKTLMRSWLDDIQGAYFTDSECNVWLNNSQRQVQQILLQAGQNYYMKPVETNTIASQADYLFPVDFMVENRLELVLSNYATPNEVRQPVAPITTNQQDMIPIALGTPTNYYIKKDRFTLSPIPSNIWTMRLYYSYRVADMGSDLDSPDVPDEFHEYVAILATYDGFIKDDRAPENLERKRVYYETRLKEMATNRVQDSPRRVVMTSDYDNGGAWF